METKKPSCKDAGSAHCTGRSMFHVKRTPREVRSMQLLEAALATIQDSRIHYFVQDKKAAWEYATPTFYVYLTIRPGRRIESVVQDAIDFSQRAGIGVDFHFNDKLLKVNANSTVDAVVAAYLNP